MKIGYPCINRSIGCTANRTFRLRNYSEGLLIEKVSNNLDCLFKILRWNLSKGLMFFRISSDLIPFASHPVCKFDWVKHFDRRFKEIGRFILNNKIRISMHPDQFVLINALKKDIVKRSISELKYHCQVLDAMGLDSSAKVQIHIGGVYGDKEKSKERFVKEYKKLPYLIKKRLAIENDHYMYSLKDCLDINEKTKIPIIFDNFHHFCYNNGESYSEAVSLADSTWRRKDGLLMTDYSSQKKRERKGKHAEHINIRDFKKYVQETKKYDFDIMLEIKDKEKSALKAVKVLDDLKLLF